MTNTYRTQLFLRQLTRRLSGRQDCKHVEFKIGIGVRFPESTKLTSPKIDDSRYIFFEPHINVYRDNHHRKAIDLRDVVDLIVQNYYSDLIIGWDTLGNTLVDTSQFVQGVYQYKLSVTKHKRRWIRLDRTVINGRKSHRFIFLYNGGTHEDQQDNH